MLPFVAGIRRSLPQHSPNTTTGRIQHLWTQQTCRNFYILGFFLSAVDSSLIKSFPLKPHQETDVVRRFKDERVWADWVEQLEISSICCIRAGNLPQELQDHRDNRYLRSSYYQLVSSLRNRLQNFFTAEIKAVNPLGDGIDLTQNARFRGAVCKVTVNNWQQKVGPIRLSKETKWGFYSSYLCPFCLYI